MPIYDQTYRNYDGSLRTRGRWWVIACQEIRVLSKSRLFAYMLIAASFHFFLRVLQVVAVDVIAQNPNNPLAAAIQSNELFMVNSKMFFDFLRIQAPLVFLISILIGSGMIANDVRNNLMEVLFSKPITWRDYVMGKAGTLILIGLATTAAPGILLLILHNLLAPGWRTVQETWWLLYAVPLFSLVVVAPASFAILAGSSLFRSANLAAIAVFMIFSGNATLGPILSELLHARNYIVSSFPFAIHRVGEVIFDRPHHMTTLGWGWSAAYVAAVTLGAMWIVCRRVRRAEIAV